jgi:hypothetical protein
MDDRSKSHRFKVITRISKKIQRKDKKRKKIKEKKKLKENKNYIFLFFSKIHFFQKITEITCA